MPRIYVSLDLEFTGLDPRRDHIIEIGMVKFRGRQVLDTFSTLVNPHRPVPYKIQQMIGVSQIEVDRAPSLDSLRGKILAFVQNHPLVGHTIETDLSFLNRQGPLLRNLAIDTFELASILLPEAKRYGLADLATLLDIDLPQNHRAFSDAVATKDLFLALVDRASQWDLGVLQEITRLSGNSGWSLLRVFRDILSDRQGSRGTTLLSPRIGEPVPFSPVAEEEIPPLQPSANITPIDEAALADVISPGGLFARSFPGYEDRPQQVDMLRAVAEAFNTPAHLLVEAGTGIGKSVAYLLPAIHFAMQNGRRVVIASNTINLQDQLYNKDIPDLQRILSVPFRAALLKGRTNYLCLRRLAAFRRARQLSTEEARVLAKILAWLPSTRTGDRAELLLINTEPKIWAQVQCSSEICLGEHCALRQAGKCFFYRARARAERAHLISVNHALLLSDLALENRILPEYKYVIIDEAHHLEEQATSQFGFEVGRQDVYAFLASLSHRVGDRPGGLLAEVPRLFLDQAVGESAQGSVTSLIQDLLAEIDSAQRCLYELFDVLAGFLQDHAAPPDTPRPLYNQTYRLTSGSRTQPGWTAVEIASDNLSAPLSQLLRGLERLLALVVRLDSHEDTERDELAQEIRARLQRGTEMWAGLNEILLNPAEDGIYWISLSQRTREMTLHSAPLHVGPMIEERLFASNDCVVLTSATLGIGGSFRFIKERLALEDPIELALGSPFNFQTSVLLYVPKDIPEPRQPYYQKRVEQAIVDLCRATEGRALVLFTSNSQLYTTYHATQRALAQDRIVLYGQGIDGSRRQILESFRSTPRSVLMGTRSFWEGIDVVGPALSCLVIVRLPFSVPTDPVIAARAETFEEPFNEYYLPQAILRFRQGFGRLIRSRDDYGVVAVLDARLLSKSYGKTFLRSLPPCTARQGPLTSLPIVAQRWLDPERRK